jgi:hypothetical protein
LLRGEEPGVQTVPGLELNPVRIPLLALVFLFECKEPLGAEKVREQSDGRAIEIVGRAVGGGGTVERQGIQAVGGDEVAPGQTLAVEGGHPHQ